ncbi:YIP1 family protein [Flavobacterium sp. I3-2]|uniref:YIP1 family protein n=1 Tax=Flavobacterium sp. I3-2 TaxID=2748319 RepID=UPI0015AD4AAF|nr:YIP1 family protein [Flavobacterium sp. I3-2]
MKNNILLNPFAILSDKKQTIIGLISLIFGILIAHFMTINIQILRIDPVENVSLLKSFLNLIICILFLSLAFFGIGKIINKKTRFIDIINTVLLSFIPVYISLFQNLNHFLNNEIDKLIQTLKNGDIYNLSPPILFLIVGLVGFVFFIYYVYLLFIGFKTATNSKKAWHYVLFFATLIIVDLLTSYIINSF